MLSNAWKFSFASILSVRINAFSKQGGTKEDYLEDKKGSLWCKKSSRTTEIWKCVKKGGW